MTNIKKPKEIIKGNYTFNYFEEGKRYEMLVNMVAMSWDEFEKFYDELERCRSKLKKIDIYEGNQ